MADHQHDSGSPESHDDHHFGSSRLFIGVFAGLCVLTAISFAVGSSPLMRTPSVGYVIMIAVSVCKALLVMLFFMHLKWEANWKYVLTIPATVMSIFLVLALIPDIYMRTWNYAAERMLYAPSAEHIHHADEHESGEHGDEPADENAGH